MFKLLFDKKNGSLGGIYEDMKCFERLYPKAENTFKKAITELCVHLNNDSLFLIYSYAIIYRMHS